VPERSKSHDGIHKYPMKQLEPWIVFFYGACVGDFISALCTHNLWFVFSGFVMGLIGAIVTWQASGIAEYFYLKDDCRDVDHLFKP